jgi:hypothetical protein
MKRRNFLSAAAALFLCKYSGALAEKIPPNASGAAALPETVLTHYGLSLAKSPTGGVFTLLFYLPLTAGEKTEPDPRSLMRVTAIELRSQGVEGAFISGGEGIANYRMNVEQNGIRGGCTINPAQLLKLPRDNSTTYFVHVAWRQFVSPVVPLIIKA